MSQPLPVNEKEILVPSSNLSSRYRGQLSSPFIFTFPISQIFVSILSNIDSPSSPDVTSRQVRDLLVVVQPKVFGLRHPQLSYCSHESCYVQGSSLQAIFYYFKLLEI